jgi:hypothetical protein
MPGIGAVIRLPNWLSAKPMPLGTSTTVPVMSAAASESRNATRSAASVALANRRSAIASVSRAGAVSGQIGVMSARPPCAAGATALARIPYRLVWLASARTNPTIPARAAPEPRSAASPYTPDTEETATIRPDCRSIMAGSTARHRWNTPSRLVSITARQSASSSRVSGRSRVRPAQLTTACTGPSSSSARRAQAVTSAARVRSAWTTSTRAPSSEAAFSTSTAERSSR